MITAGIRRALTTARVGVLLTMLALFLIGEGIGVSVAYPFLALALMVVYAGGILRGGTDLSWTRTVPPLITAVAYLIPAYLAVIEYLTYNTEGYGDEALAAGEIAVSFGVAFLLVAVAAAEGETDGRD